MTHADHVFLGLPWSLVPGSPNHVMELMHEVARCTCPYHLRRRVRRTAVISSRSSFWWSTAEEIWSSSFAPQIHLIMARSCYWYWSLCRDYMLWHCWLGVWPVEIVLQEWGFLMVFLNIFGAHWLTDVHVKMSTKQQYVHLWFQRRCCFPAPVACDAPHHPDVSVEFCLHSRPQLLVNLSLDGLDLAWFRSLSSK